MLKTFKCSIQKVTFYVVVINKQGFKDLLHVGIRSGFWKKSRLRSRSRSKSRSEKLSNLDENSQKLAVSPKTNKQKSIKLIISL